MNMPFPVTNPGTAPSWSSATNWGDIRWNINNQIDLIAKYYDKPTIDDMLAQLWGSGKMVVVDALPATWEDWFIYLLSHDGTWNPPFDMYIWTQDNTFQLIWDTTIDLSNVYTKQEANERFQIQLIAGDLINLTDTWIISVKNVYNKTEVDDLIDAIDTVKMLVVPELPTVGRVNVIYLTPTEDPDVYEQWIWEIDTTVTPPTEWWKQVGTMEIDLSQYYTKDETDEKFLQIKDEKVLVYPFVWIGWIVEDMIDKLNEWKAIVLSTYDDQDPDSAEFWWISEYTNTYFVVERPTQRETYTYDSNFEVTNISIDDEPPLYRRDYRFGGNETDRLIRNLFTQAKTYNDDTELSLDELITEYAEWMFYKLLVTNNSLTDPITLSLDTGIENPYGWDMTIPVGEQVLYLFVREDHELKLLYSTRELNKKQDWLEEGVAITPLTDNQKLSVVNLTTKKVDHVTWSDIWDYVEDKIDGAVSNVLTDDFPTWNRAVVSNPMWKFAICDTTTEEINYVHWVTSNVQTQLDDKQPKLTTWWTLSWIIDGTEFSQVRLWFRDVVTIPALAIWNYVKTKITGAISWLLETNLTANKALLSDGNGKIAVSSVTNTELGYVSGVTSSIQTQLNDMWKKIYPVGSIYTTVDKNFNPGTTFGGTWSLVGADRVLWGTASGGTGGQNIAEQLPNIKGTLDFSGGSQWHPEASVGGAFYKTANWSGTYPRPVEGSSSSGTRKIGFDASKSSSIYTDNGHVRPNGYSVFFWRRTA